ncbi:MAG: Lactose operon repressor [Anaerolineae bacterium]|nr:Lactose operon repressor [Anaerolineae bacterium]
MPSPKKRVNIKIVAQEAGVSTQTVSRVINNRPDVAESTRQHVLAVINQLDYRPSALARSLIRQRSHTLGVVTAGLGYWGPSRTLNGIADQAEAMGYSLLLKELPRFDLDNVEPITNALLASQVDGVIWAVAEVGNNHAWLRDSYPHLSVPIVFLTMQPYAGLTTVSVNNHLGAQMVVEHLLERGYRRIGHITGPLTWWEAQQRKAGWETALTAAGLPPDATHWAEGDWDAAGGQQAFQQLRQQYPAMDAVFVANDQMALGVLQLACKTGIRVPQDLAVAGFDNRPESEFYWPPLTTVKHNLRDLGSQAVQKIVQIIEQEQPSELTGMTTWVTPELIIRASTTP